MKNPFIKMEELYLTGFRQSSDATCGPASVILAALSFGLPKQDETEWRHPRFKPLFPIDDFLKRGMALHELQIISERIYMPSLEIVLTRAYSENLKNFIADIKASIERKTSIIILNYRQDDFVPNTNICDQGNPHYSPILDWDSDKKEILIADVDPLIMTAYWVSINAMFESMTHINPAFGMPRGWLKLKLRNKP